MEKPENKEELEKLILDHFKRGVYDLNDIDTSEITDMSSLFIGCTMYSFDVSRWDTRKVENMFQTFWGCVNFNSDISRWQTGRVTDMGMMFYGCQSFNQDLSKWNVKRVKNRRLMFKGCISFNHDISKWGVRGSEKEEMFHDLQPDKNKRNWFLKTWNDIFGKKTEGEEGLTYFALTIISVLGSVCILFTLLFLLLNEL